MDILKFQVNSSVAKTNSVMYMLKNLSLTGLISQNKYLKDNVTIYDTFNGDASKGEIKAETYIGVREDDKAPYTFMRFFCATFTYIAQDVWVVKYDIEDKYFSQYFSKEPKEMYNFFDWLLNVRIMP